LLTAKCSLQWRVRRLIVNADDFGLTPGVNRAIAEARRDGIVTSATLMAGGTAFDDAVRLANAAPTFSVGCHVVLVDGSPTLHPSQIPTLIVDKAQFEPSLISFAARVIRGRIDTAHVEAEATAQIRRLQAAGIQVSHVDTHKHTHVFPRILLPVLRAARACGVKAIRNPFGRVAFSLIASRPNLWKRYAQIKLLNTLSGNFQRAVSEEGMATTDGSLGVVATGAIDDRLLRFILEHVPDGTWELVTHPGYNDADLQKVRTRLRESREKELAILRSPESRNLLDLSGIQLISYRDVV
jgi:hopanoid biosynthesis associated protein HpnK